MLTDPVVSPSGKRIAFVGTRQDKKADVIDSRLWVLTLADGKAVETAADMSVRLFGLTWSPDESAVIFITGGTEKFNGLGRIELASNSVSSVEASDCWSPKYSPDGRFFGFARKGDSRDPYRLVIENSSTSERLTVAEGENHWYWCWCWDRDGTGVFYSKNKGIFRYDIQTRHSEPLVEARSGEKMQAEFLTLSPDGTRLGYFSDKWFYEIDLKTRGVRKLFEADHYFECFQWTPQGIFYLDKDGAERRRQARLMLYDTKAGKSAQISVGPYSYIQPLNDSQVLVRWGNMELHAIDIRTGKDKLIFSGAGR